MGSSVAWAVESKQFGETQHGWVCSFLSHRQGLIYSQWRSDFGANSDEKKGQGGGVRQMLAQSYLLNGLCIVFYEACTELLSSFSFLF